MKKNKKITKAKHVTAKHIAKCCTILEEYHGRCVSMRIFDDYSGGFLKARDNRIEGYVFDNKKEFVKVINGILNSAK